MNFYVVLFIEVAANGLDFKYPAICCDEKLPRYGRFKLQSGTRELDLRHNSGTIVVHCGKLRRVSDRERQCRL
jgi:hypothetical protein